jgi:hypothetical protein
VSEGVSVGERESMKERERGWGGCMLQRERRLTDLTGLEWAGRLRQSDTQQGTKQAGPKSRENGSQPSDEPVMSQ